VLGGELVASLKKLHDALAAEHRHFGYRVAREIARFVNLAVAQTGDETAARAAFDVAVLAKILPKLHGSQNEVEALLKRLLALAIDDRPEAEVFVNGNLRPEVISDISLPRSARKLSRMLRRLTARGFVSYIE
jgi:5-methylcytosine-specific restriction protein B